MSSYTITRMLPFRQYDENDVINLFSLDTVTGEAGSLVKVSSANLGLDPVSLVERGDQYAYQNYLGNASSLYPEVPHKVSKVTATGEVPLGLLLRDVRAVDENGENLQYYPEKREELQCVLSGQAVPIATKGLFMLNSRSFANGIVPAVNSVAIPAANGKLTGVASPTDEQKKFVVGKFLATGFRESQQDTDEFAGPYAMLKLEL
ncbi:hypothetical protein N9955_00775 [bacterium]|nr:hypothetical protein [bacterium]